LFTRMAWRRWRSTTSRRITATGCSLTTVLLEIHAPLVGVHDEGFVDGNVVPRLGTAPSPAARRLGEPRVPGVLVPRPLQRFRLAVVPAAHGKALAPVRDGLVGRLALVANERPELDANGGEAELLEFAAVGTDRVGGEPRELPDLLLGGCEIGHVIMVWMLLRILRGSCLLGYRRPSIMMIALEEEGGCRNSSHSQQQRSRVIFFEMSLRPGHGYETYCTSRVQ
jgi:hypothetical protein